MTRIHLKKLSLISSTLLGTLSLVTVPVSALASVGPTAPVKTASTSTTKADQTKITFIITHGNTEVNRRFCLE